MYSVYRGPRDEGCMKWRVRGLQTHQTVRTSRVEELSSDLEQQYGDLTQVEVDEMPVKYGPIKRDFQQTHMYVWQGKGRE